MNHDPDTRISDGDLTIVMSTHSAGASPSSISDARRVDALLCASGWRGLQATRGFDEEFHVRGIGSCVAPTEPVAKRSRSVRVLNRRRCSFGGPRPQLGRPSLPGTSY